MATSRPVPGGVTVFDLAGCYARRITQEKQQKQAQAFRVCELFCICAGFTCKKSSRRGRLFQLFQYVPFVLYVFHSFINVLENEKTLINQCFLMCFVPIVPMFHSFCKFFIYIIYIIFIYIFLLYYYIKLKNNWNIGTNKEKHV